MGAKSLSERGNWQMGAAITGKKGEDRFAVELQPFLPSHYEIRVKPPKIILYGDGKGVQLDHSITNHKTGKSLLVEKKTGSRGGNAHERAYKFATAGMQKALRKHITNTAEKPVMFVFSGKTFSGPSFRKEDGSLVDPQKYQDELELTLADENYAIIDRDWSNVSQIAEQIMEIV